MLNTKKRYNHGKMIELIAEKKGMKREVVDIIIKNFYNTIRSLLLRNEEVNIKGLFKLVFRTHFKKKIEQKGKNINLRIRKQQKKYPIKKA